MVPSSGSITQRLPDDPTASAPSSPSTPSSGRSACSSREIASSAPRSASETMSVDEDFESSPSIGSAVQLQQQLAGRAGGSLGKLEVGQSVRAISTIAVTTPEEDRHVDEEAERLALGAERVEHALNI